MILSSPTSEVLGNCVGNLSLHLNSDDFKPKVWFKLIFVTQFLLFNLYLLKFLKIMSCIYSFYFNAFLRLYKEIVNSVLTLTVICSWLYRCMFLYVVLLFSVLFESSPNLFKNEDNSVVGLKYLEPYRRLLIHIT